MDIQRAINEIRKRLDEIEELAQQLPPSKNKNESEWVGRYGGPTAKLSDWMDLQGYPNKSALRRPLAHVVMLIEQGLTLEQIKKHRIIRKRKVVHEYIDDFYAKWTSR